MSSSVHLRRARPADVAAIRELHGRSLRLLGRGHYQAELLDAVIAAGTLEPALLHAGHYQVAIVERQIVGCGGWVDGKASGSTASSMKRMRASAKHQPAIIRAVYVDPAHARLGIGSRLMAAIEADAMAFGKSTAELMATHMAVRFFGRLGYVMETPLSLELRSGAAIDVFAMRKALTMTPAWPLGAMPHKPTAFERASVA